MLSNFVSAIFSPLLEKDIERLLLVNGIFYQIKMFLTARI